MTSMRWRAARCVSTVQTGNEKALRPEAIPWASAVVVRPEPPGAAEQRVRAKRRRNEEEQRGRATRKRQVEPRATKAETRKLRVNARARTENCTQNDEWVYK